MLRKGMFVADRYEVLDLIGSGGMAEVYRAKCHKLNRFIALKVLKPEFCEDKNFVKKFRMEAQSVACLAHGNIVGVYDVGEDNGVYFIVMELVDGITLKDYISRRGKLGIRESIGISIQVAQGLAAAHAHNIIHRDIKPQNIMISRDGKVKVADFGIARAITDETTNMYGAMGSVHYISPEQARGGYCDERSDIYSLGITMYEMLTGKVPFDGDNTVAVAVAHINDPLTPPSYYEPEIPVAIEQIVFKCTQKKPQRRYASCMELITDLRRALVTPEENFVEKNQDDLSGKTIPLDEQLEQIRSGGVQDGMETDYLGADAERDVYSDSDRENYSSRQDSIRMEEGAEPEIENTLFDRVILGIGVAFAVILIVLLIYVVGSLAGWFRSSVRSSVITTQPETTLSPYETKMPDIVGQKQIDAIQMLQDAELTYELADVAYSDDYPSGTVYKQEYEPGTILEKDTKVKLTISMGTDKFIVSKEFVGRVKTYLDTAIQGYDIKVIYEYRDSAQTKDIILELDPANGQLKSGDTLKVYLSSGGGSADEYNGSSGSNEKDEDEDKVTVPDLSWLDKQELEKVLTELGLKVGTVTEEYSNSVAKGYVISQKTKAASKVDRGTAVDVVISKGNGTVNTPRVVGLTQEEAEEELEEAGLIAVIQRESSNTVAKGKVIWQTPGEGRSVTEGSSITIGVSTGRQPSSTAEASEQESSTQESSASAANTIVLSKNILDMNQAEARSALIRQGITVVVELQFNDDVPKDDIIALYRGSQKLQAGDELKEGETLRMIVSSGPNL